MNLGTIDGCFPHFVYRFLSNLRTIRLRYNRVQFVSPELLLSLPKLTTFQVTDNPINCECYNTTTDLAGNQPTLLKSIIGSCSSHNDTGKARHRTSPPCRNSMRVTVYPLRAQVQWAQTDQRIPDSNIRNGVNHYWLQQHYHNCQACDWTRSWGQRSIPKWSCGKFTHMQPVRTSWSPMLAYQVLLLPVVIARSMDGSALVRRLGGNSRIVGYTACLWFSCLVWCWYEMTSLRVLLDV